VARSGWQKPLRTRTACGLNDVPAEWFHPMRLCRHRLVRLQPNSAKPKARPCHERTKHHVKQHTPHGIEPS